MGPKPEDEKKDSAPAIEGHGLRPATAVVAAVAALAAPPEEGTTRDWKDDRIESLQDRITAELKEVRDLQKRTAELAGDRDKWKVRAEKAEAAGDGLALERVTKERDGLRVEVSKLSKKILESNKEKDEEIAHLKSTLKVSMADANEAASQTSRFRTTTEQAIKARDTAVAAKETAEQERLEVVKRVADLEGQVKALKEKLQPPAVKAAGTPPLAKVAASK